MGKESKLLKISVASLLLGLSIIYLLSMVGLPVQRLLTPYVILPQQNSEDAAEDYIYDLSVSAEEPVVLEDFAVNVGIKNLEENYNEFLLEVSLTKEGQVIKDIDFTFGLEAKQKTTFSPSITAESIGSHKVIVKLYDKYRAILYSERVADISVISEIGPFDISLETLSKTVKPDYHLPLHVKIKNMGTKGTDVKLVLSMDCLKEDDIRKESSIFVGGGGELDEYPSIKTCGEEGRRDITAELFLYDHKFAESLNQIVINGTHHEFAVDLPNRIIIKQGGSKVNSANVKNNVDNYINHLSLMIENIPQEWVEISPEVVNNLKPNQSAIFVFNITVPPDAAVEEYPLKFHFGSDEALLKEDVILDVKSVEYEEEVEEEGILEKLEEYKTFMLIGVIVVLAVVLAVSLLRKRSSSNLASKIKKIKNITD